MLIEKSEPTSPRGMTDRCLAVAVGLLLICGSLASTAEAKTTLQDNVPAEERNDATATRPAVLIPISLPVNSQSAEVIKSALKRVVEQAPPFINPKERQVVVLEFETARGKTGAGSELEACQSVARFMASSEMNRVETVAYVPTDTRDKESTSRLEGHAVLIAIAANQIALDEKASLGNAGIDESNQDPLVKAVYQSVAEQRMTLRSAVVMSMLDGQTMLYRVRTDKESVFVNAEELAELEASGQALETETLSKQGEALVLSSQQLVDLRLIRYRVSSRAELARQLDLQPNSLNDNLLNADGRRPVLIELPPYVDQRIVSWTIRALTSQMSAANPPNLIIVKIDNNDGDVNACLNLARHFSEYDAAEVQTVAFVKGAAQGSVGVLALVCDQLIMTPDSHLGGHLDMPAGSRLDQETLADVKPMVQALARDRQVDWSLMLSMLDPSVNVSRYKNVKTQQIRLLGDEEFGELADGETWAQLGPLNNSEGLAANTAEQLYLARTQVKDLNEIVSFYDLKELPPALRPSATDRWVERVAMFLSRPAVSFLLLFLGMFFFSTEMNAPGVGVPGFLSAICFLLFFWSQYLGGNAHWLEVLLFLVGVVFLAMEIFILPGFGIFGIGGLLMILVSLMLASQDFIIPRNSKELAQLPNSLMPLVGAGLGFFAAIYALRKVLPNSPYFSKMLLKPRRPYGETGLDADHDPEAIVDWSFLQGKTGETVTKLMPSGKARIAGKVYDVMADGRMVEKSQKVKVVEAVGNRIVVQPVDEADNGTV